MYALPIYSGLLQMRRAIGHMKLATQQHAGTALNKPFGLQDNHIHKSHTYWAERADGTNRICSPIAKRERYAHLTFVQSTVVGFMIRGRIGGGEQSTIIVHAEYSIHGNPHTDLPPAYFQDSTNLNKFLGKSAWVRRDFPNHRGRRLLYERLS